MTDLATYLAGCTSSGHVPEPEGQYDFNRYHAFQVAREFPGCETPADYDFATKKFLGVRHLSLHVRSELMKFWWRYEVWRGETLRCASKERVRKVLGE